VTVWKCMDFQSSRNGLEYTVPQCLTIDPGLAAAWTMALGHNAHHLRDHGNIPSAPRTSAIAVFMSTRSLQEATCRVVLGCRCADYVSEACVHFISRYNVFPESVNELLPLLPFVFVYIIINSAKNEYLTTATCACDGCTPNSMIQNFWEANCRSSVKELSRFLRDTKIYYWVYNDP
jgi:hypothetical protein